MGSLLQATAVILGTFQGAVHGGDPCPRESLSALQSEYSNCTADLIYKFQDTRHTFPGQTYVEEAACILVQKVLSECGQILKKCHSKEEVDMIGDEYVERLLAQYSDVKMSHCNEVTEMRGKVNTIHEEPNCDDDEIQSLNIKYTKCTDQAARDAHSSLTASPDLSKEAVKDILCLALREVEGGCSRALADSNCHSTDDLNTLTLTKTRDIKTLLVRLGRNLITVKQLEDCPYQNDDEKIDTTDTTIEASTKDTPVGTSPDEESNSRANIDSKNDKEKKSDSNKNDSSKLAPVIAQKQMSPKVLHEPSSDSVNFLSSTCLVLSVAFLLQRL